jgi:hypothetical protein
MGDAPVFFLMLLALPLLLVGVVLVGVFALLGPILGFLISLPFRLIGLLFGLLGWLLVLPLLLVGGVLLLGGLALGFGAFLLVPLLVCAIPFALVAMGMIWLMRRGDRHTVHAS